MDSLTQTSLLQPIRFDANPKVGGEFVQDTIRSFHIFNQHLSSCLRARLKRIHPAFTKMISLDYLSRHLFTSVQTQPPRSGLALTGGRCAIQLHIPTGRGTWIWYPWVPVAGDGTSRRCRLSGLADGITHHISFRHISIKSSFIHKYIEHNSSYLGTVLLFTEYIHNCKRNLDSYYSRLCLSADFSLKRSI